MARPIGDGTVLTTNVYALTFNFASHEGNKLRLEGLDAYDINRAETCARYGEKSAADEERVRTEMNLIRGSHERTTADVSLMERCYDTDVLHPYFTNEAPKEPPHYTCSEDVCLEMPSPQEKLADPNCKVSLSNATLEDGLYDCGQLPDCTSINEICVELADEYGNDRSELYSYTRTAMCTAQWWFHAFVLRMVFSVAIWVCLKAFDEPSWKGPRKRSLTRACCGMFAGLPEHLPRTAAQGPHPHALDAAQLWLLHVPRHVHLRPCGR